MRKILSISNLLLVLFFGLLSFQTYAQPKIQATIKPGPTANSVSIFTKTTANLVGFFDDQVTITLAVPVAVAPAPQMGTTGTRSNLVLGPISGGTNQIYSTQTGTAGLRPNITFDSVLTGNREVVITTQTINGASYYVFTFIFANSLNQDSHDYIANVEQKLLTVQFDQCASNCDLIGSGTLLVSLANGGTGGNSFFYYQVTGPSAPGEVTNRPALFYQNPLSTKANNGGANTVTSTIGIAPSLTIADVTQAEGNTGTTNFGFTITLSAPAGIGGATFDIATSDGTATAGSDYVANTSTLTIPAGSSSITYNVAVNGDAVVEPTETFNVNITNPNGVVISDGAAVGTITNDDVAAVIPNLSINDVSQLEGSIGQSTPMTFTISLSSPAGPGGVTFDVTSADNTAIYQADYVASNMPGVFIPQGGTSATYTATIVGDQTFEPDETFFVNISNVTGANVVKGQGIGTILNDDAATTPAVSSITSPSPEPTNAASITFSVVFTESVTGVDAGDFVLTTTGVNSPSITGVSGSGSNYTVTVNTGTGSGTIRLDFISNGTVTNGTNATNANFTTGRVVTIDKTAPFVTNIINFNGNPTTTNAADIYFTVSFSEGVSGVDVSDFGLTTTGGIAGASIFEVSGSNESTYRIGVHTGTGSGTIRLNFTSNGSITDLAGNPTTTNFTTGTVYTIDKTAPAVNSIVRANPNPTVASSVDFTVTFSESVSFVDATSFQTATTGSITGTSVTGVTGSGTTYTVTVNTGTGSGTVGLNFISNGSVVDVVGNPTTANFTAGEVYSINRALPGLTINDVTQVEGNTGTSLFTFTVNLSSAAPAGGVTFNVATADGTATAGSDYVALAATGTIAAGATSTTVSVTVNGDALYEGNETFFVNLSNPTNATITDGQGLGTITNDDAAPSLSISDVTQAEGNAGTSTFSFTVSLSAASGLPVTFGIATADGTATAGSDYVARALSTQTIPAGSTTYTYDVSVNGDVLYEGNETFFVNLSNATNATITDNQGLGTINNDDVPDLSINSIGGFTEGNSGTKAFVFTVSLSGPAPTGGVSFTVATRDAAPATATAGSDYVSLNTTGFIPAGSTSTTVTVLVNGDVLYEGDEFFIVDVSNATNANIINSTGTATILNDDAVPSLSINDVTQAEGDAGTSTFSFTVTLSAVSGLPVTFGIATADGSATAGSDYVARALSTQTIPAGSTTYTFNVTVNGDATFEGDETFNVNLSSPTNATISDNQGVGTITNDDAAPPTPTITITDVTQAEGNTGTSLFTFTVNLSSAAPAGGVTFSVATADGTATAGSDYVTLATTGTIAAGATSTTVSVTVNGDALYEGNETFFVNLSNPTNATITDNQGVGTITNDDAVPSLSINDVTQAEGDAGTSTFSFTVTLSAVSGLPVTFGIATADGSATAGSDYVARALSTQMIPAGSTTYTFNVTVNGDATFEGDETFNVNLSSPTNATISDNQGVGTITNDDAAPPTPTITITDVTQAEGNTGTSLFTFTVNLSSAAPAGGVTFSVATADGTATAGSDYVTLAATGTIAAGATSTTVSVTVNGDALYEGNETFFVNLSNPTNATITDNQGVGTITNDDAVPSLSINDVTQAEGDAGTSTFSFTVTLSAVSGLPVTFGIATADGSATAGSDYVARALSTQTIPAGSTTYTFNVTVNGDATFEGDETFNVNLSSPTNATISDNQGVGTITNDDAAPPTPTITITDVTQAEGNTGTSLFTFTVNLSSAAPAGGVTFSVATADGTATAGSDYVTLAATGTIAAGATSTTVSVTVNGDALYEGNETFFVNLSNPTNATITDNQGVGTITNDDAVPSLSINDVTQAEGDAGTSTFSFTVTLSAVSGLPVTFGIATADGSATAGSDYVARALSTQTIPAGSTTYTFNVTVNGDATFEGDETFNVNLSSPTNATISDNQGVGTITNDDAAPPTPTITITDVTQAEGNTGTSLFTFTVNLSSAAPAGGVTFSVATADGTATAGSDYVTLAATGTIAAGATSTTVSVTVNGDALYEGNETFFVNLSNPTNATITDNQGVGTITNDDAVPSLSINDVTQAEGDAGTSTFNFTVTLSAVSGLPVTFGIATADGSATAGSDYVARALSTQTIPAGSTTYTFNVTVNGDATFEGDETFNVNLSSPTNATISDNQGVGTITNDDAPPAGSSNITDYFRTRQNGNFSNPVTWESSPDNFATPGLIISPATISPDYRANTIMVQHAVIVTANVEIDQTTVTPAGSLTVNSGVILGIRDGAGFDIVVNGNVTVNTGGFMTVRSTAAGTASVGPSTGTVTGEAIVERYIPDDGKRAWRLLSVPVSGSRTIFETWQESARNIQDSGTLITSPLANGSNGFDANSPNSSILMHNQGGASGPFWENVPSTLMALNSKPGYMLFVRGDRRATASNSLHTPTTIRSIGSLKMGTQPLATISSAGTGYTLVGNPYASSIDLETVLSFSNINDEFYIWDANLGGLYGVGGYRLVERTGAGIYRQTPQPMGGPATGPTVADNTLRYIHSGQAFFLRSTGGDATVFLSENLKTDQVPSINPFREVDLQPQIITNLVSVASDNTTAVVDGVRVRFDNAYSAAVTSEDVIKMNNFSENLGLRRNNQLLIVEKLPEISSSDTLFLNLANTTVKNYQFEVGGKNLPAGLTGYLMDNYLGTQTSIDFNTVRYIDFSVNADAASAAADRFKIVLKTSGALPVTLKSVKAYQQANNIAVEWSVQNESGVKQYEVEKSTNGTTFTTLAVQNATGNNMSTVSYSWLDLKAVTGNNFYRIRSTSLTGQVQYSQIVNVVLGKGKPEYQVYPNPITNGIINLQFINQPAGLYTARLSNALGQVLLNKQIAHAQGSSAETIELGSNVLHAHYILEISAPDKSRKSIKIIY